MSVPRSSFTPCADVIYFYAGNSLIGCSTVQICGPDSSKRSLAKHNASYHENATYYENGTYIGLFNETICGNPIQWSPGCCGYDKSLCADGCPPEILSSSPYSDVLNRVQSTTAAATSSARSSSTSYSHDLATSTLTMYNEPAPTTAGLPALTSSAAPKSTAAPASNSNAAAIAGGVTGGIAGLAVLVGLLFICHRRRKIKSQIGIDKGRFSAWNSGQPGSMQRSSAELDEIKQGPSITSSPLPPPSVPPSPLLSPLPPPPAYASYNTHGDGLAGAPDHLHPSSGSRYAPYDVPSQESPPSPPPLKTRLSQQSTSSYSDGQDVSPISSHYQHQTFDNPSSMRSSVYSEVSERVLHAHAM